MTARSAAHLAQREHAQSAEAWAGHNQWSKLSQGRRILRWVTSRPARPATMHAMRAAFTEAP
ncbi:MAG: hypothetical protein WA803_15190 [Steroidobacteraceae bacterium]